MDWWDVPYNCMGAFPTDVVDALGGNTLRNQPSLFWSRLEAPLDTYRLAEPDLALSEWYFDADTAGWMVDRFAGGWETVAAIGCPTIALEAASSSRRALLVDSSPWLDFSWNASIDHWRIRAEELSRFSVGEAVYFIDPPWHLNDYSCWLSALSHVMTPGSQVILVLPQALALRSARLIRAQAFQFFSRRGQVDVTASAVRYKTPLFESTMLAEWGMELSDWRTADLLEVTIKVLEPEHGGRGRPKMHETLEAWEPFNIGGRIVRVGPCRLSTTAQFRYQNMPQVTLRSPSRSSLLEQGINCFSSLGTGMKVTSGAQLLKNFLSHLADQGNLQKALFAVSADNESRRGLLQAYKWLVELDKEG
jgi:hypothetical protein